MTSMENFRMEIHSESPFSLMTTVAPRVEERDLTDDGCFIVKKGAFVPWDNPDNIISKEADYWYQIIHSVALVPVLFLIGAPANVLCAIVFYKQGIKDRINLCLVALAIADLLTITVIFLLTAEGAYRTITGNNAYFFITYFPGLTGFTWVSQFLSAVIASERCFCVVSPLKAKAMISTRTMAIFIVVVSAALMSGMLAIAGPKHTTACVYDPATNTTGNIIYVTEYYLNHKWILDILDVFLYATALPILFLIVIIVTTAVTAATLRSSLAFRRNCTLNSLSSASSSASRGHYSFSKEVALTRMLLATSVLFIVCLTPNVVVQIATFCVPDLAYNRRYHNLTATLWSIISLFRVINSSVNFFIYCYMGSRFRKSTKEIVCGCLHRCRRQALRHADSVYVIESQASSMSPSQSWLKLSRNLSAVNVAEKPS